MRTAFDEAHKCRPKAISFNAQESRVNELKSQLNPDLDCLSQMLVAVVIDAYDQALQDRLPGPALLSCPCPKAPLEGPCDISFRCSGRCMCDLNRTYAVQVAHTVAKVTLAFLHASKLGLQCNKVVIAAEQAQ